MFRISSCSLLLFAAFLSSAEGVPAARNAAVVEGAVLEDCSGSSERYGVMPPQILYKLTLKITRVRDYGTLRNFLKGMEGRELEFFSKERLPENLTGKKVKMRVEYRGDERGGKAWIRSIEVLDEEAL